LVFISPSFPLLSHYYHALIRWVKGILWILKGAFSHAAGILFYNLPPLRAFGGRLTVPASLPYSFPACLNRDKHAYPFFGFVWRGSVVTVPSPSCWYTLPSQDIALRLCMQDAWAEGEGREDGRFKNATGLRDFAQAAWLPATLFVGLLDACACGGFVSVPRGRRGARCAGSSFWRRYYLGACTVPSVLRSGRDLRGVHAAGLLTYAACYRPMAAP
jgi:hypothetical protein